MVGHKAIGKTNPVETLNNLTKNRKKEFPISVIFEYIRMSVAASGHVVNSTGIFYA